MSCSEEMFHKSPHNHQHYTTPYGVCGLIQHFHLQFGTKLCQLKCTIRFIPCACNTCNSFTDQFNLPCDPKLCDKTTKISYSTTLCLLKRIRLIKLMEHCHIEK